MTDQQQHQTAAGTGRSLVHLHFGTPRLDEPAPEFTVRTTLGMRSLDDYRGRWLMIFAHPADFTPVCTSEFVALARRESDFAGLGCALLGVSVDSIFAHLAWIDSIRDRFGVRIAFPIAEDVSMAMAAAYGMIHSGSASTASVRSVFVIDPDGVLRATLHYPMTVGRSADELLRLVQALQTTADGRCATPEGWKPGEATVLAPPVTQGEAEDRTAGPAWYYQETAS